MSPLNVPLASLHASLNLEALSQFLRSSVPGYGSEGLAQLQGGHHFDTASANASGNWDPLACLITPRVEDGTPPQLLLPPQQPLSTRGKKRKQEEASRARF
jgi:hypothetical protein